MLSKTLAGQTVECRPLAYLVIAVDQRPRYAFQEASGRVLRSLSGTGIGSSPSR